MICTHSCHATGFLEMKSTCDTNPNTRRRNQTNRIVTANMNLSVHSRCLSSTQHMYRMRELYCCCFNRRVDWIVWCFRWWCDLRAFTTRAVLPFLVTTGHVIGENRNEVSMDVAQYKNIFVSIALLVCREKGVSGHQRLEQCRIFYVKWKFGLSRERTKLSTHDQGSKQCNTILCHTPIPFAVRKVSMTIKGQRNAKYFCVKRQFNLSRDRCQLQWKVRAMQNMFLWNANSISREKKVSKSNKSQDNAKSFISIANTVCLEKSDNGNLESKYFRLLNFSRERCQW